MKPSLILTSLAGILLVGILAAQTRPDLPPATGVGIVRALPIEPGGPNDPPPMPFPEPGFHGDFMMEGIPGRYQLITASIQQDGKTVPVVLKLDTMNGQVWRLLVTSHTLLRQGKPQVETRMEFSPILTQGQPIRPAHPPAGGAVVPGHIDPLPAPVEPELIDPPVAPQPDRIFRGRPAPRPR